MEICYREISQIKLKFARLLSFLYHSVHLELDNISNILISSSFLDLFENNQLERFMSMNNVDILTELFPNNTAIYEENNNDIGELYWSGIQYMNIFLNYRMPLKQILLTLPLNEMVKKYQIYHEMNEIELCRDYIKNEYLNNSILKYFRNKKMISTRQLSLITQISESTLKRAEGNNEYLFSISSKTISILSSVLDIPPIFLKKKSDFIPLTYGLLTNGDYLNSIRPIVGEYIKNSLPHLEIRFYKEKSSKKEGVFLYINDYSSIIINNKEKIIDNSIMRQLLSIGLDEYLSKYLIDNLVF